MDWCVLDLETLDYGRGEASFFEELRFRFAAIAAFTSPPFGPIGIDNMIRGPCDRDMLSSDAYERTLPFFISESCGSLKDDLSALERRLDDL